MTPTIQPKDPQSLEGRKFRFIVRSAEEAVTLIRERLGENARVLSVNQVGGKGLSRFLSSPKLEIVATVPRQETHGLKDADPINTQAPSQLEPEHTVTKIYTQNTNVLNTPERSINSKSLTAILNQIGFNEHLFASIRPRSNWETLQNMPLQQGLSEIGYSLREAYKKSVKTPTTTRMAFIGTPGVGKTTALCKRVAHDVFINNKSPKVFQLENDSPNSNEALSVFCNALGVPLLRDNIDQKNINESDLIYFDVPGIAVNSLGSWAELNDRLDEFNIDTRILVINAVYEADFIKNIINAATRLEATHLGLTHLDEVNFTTKLWPFILTSNLCPLFLSYGQTITGDITEKIFEHLIDKTFPPIIRNNLSASFI